MENKTNMQEIEKYVDLIPLKDKICSKIWFGFSLIFFKPFVGNVFNSYRVNILKLFGAKIGNGSVVYSSTKVICPWNLIMGRESCLGPGVKLHYDKIIIGSKVTVSQNTYLCSASHDISSLNLPFISEPIIIKDYAWIAAECFIGMGVTIGTGAIVGARSCVFKDVPEWKVVAGNPFKVIKERKTV